jgi:hypothetical protein
MLKAKIKMCTNLCPQCKRLCLLQAEHTGEMHRCGFHEWIYGAGNRFTAIFFYNGLENDNNKNRT